MTVKGDNNFQDNESRTLNIHYNRNSLAWKCIWDGQLYYRVGDFSVQWQKDQYNVTMSFINTIDLDDVSQVRYLRRNHFIYGKSHLCESLLIVNFYKESFIVCGFLNDSCKDSPESLIALTINLMT